ncbi:hypothetical protein Hanom_Chr05g00404021 [Helianthus anomalus]
MFPLKSKLPTFNLHLWIKLKLNHSRNNSQKPSRRGGWKRFLIPSISPPHRNPAVISSSPRPNTTAIHHDDSSIRGASPLCDYISYFYEPSIADYVLLRPSSQPHRPLLSTPPYRNRTTLSRRSRRCLEVPFLRLC